MLLEINSKSIESLKKELESMMHNRVNIDFLKDQVSKLQKDVEDLKPQASGILCTMIVGGAIIPPLYGYFTDLAGFKTAMILLLACYGYIYYFAKSTSKNLV